MLPPELAEAALQLEDLLARHDGNRLDAREIGGQRLGNALPDPVVGGVAGDVGEVEDRAPLRRRRASTRPAAPSASATRRPRNRSGSARR